MVEQNKDNVLLERGTFRIRGNENIRAGMFVRLRRGGFSAEYYVVTVEHEYVPFSGFFSTLTVERGMGFVERRSEEHTSELQSLMRISYAVFCLKKKKQRTPSALHCTRLQRTHRAHEHHRHRPTQ